MPSSVEHELVAVLADAARGRRRTPIARASSAWATRWRYSPCTGMNHSGRAIDSSVLSSSCLAWPVACTSAMPECTTSAPSRTSPSMTLETLVSLPGMGCELRITVSSAPILSHRFSLAAMSASADIGSPWLTRCEMTQTSPGSRSPTSSMSTQRVVGDVQQAHLAGQPHVLLHRQAERGDRAAERDGGVGDLLDAVDVAGEAGDDDAPALVLVEQVVEHLADRASRLRVCPGSSALVESDEQQADAVVLGDGADAGEVGEAAVDRREVELQVAGVQDHALRRVERGGEAVRHRVGDGDELDVERADRAALAVARPGSSSVRSSRPASSMRLRARPSVSAEP